MNSPDIDRLLDRMTREEQVSRFCQVNRASRLSRLERLILVISSDLGENRRSGVALKVGHPSMEVHELLGPFEFSQTELVSLLLPWRDGVNV